jgi:hypothetical protein
MKGAFLTKTWRNAHFSSWRKKQGRLSDHLRGQKA